MQLRTGCLVWAIFGLLNFASQAYQVYQEITVLNVASCVLGLLAHLILLAGVIKTNGPAIATYLVLEAVRIVFFIVYGGLIFLGVGWDLVKDQFLATCDMYQYGQGMCQNIAAVSFITTGLLYVYFWLCVYSFLKEVKAPDTSPNMEMSAIPKA